MMMKDGVQLNGMTTQILLAINVANGIYLKYGYELVVTSLSDGKHGRGSLHYVGMAVDLRIRMIESDSMVTRIVADIASSLGDEYDILLETDHIHIEWDIK